MTAIETDELTKQFGDVLAVEELDLTVENGEVYGFLGPNGAGKSTTIDLLLGFTQPTAGTARVLGHDVQAESVSIRDRIGILPESAALYERVTGREHLDLAMEIKDVDGEPAELLDRVGIAPNDADRPAGEYSKGMGQRLGLGMALVGDPELLILDEPSSGLDPTGIAEMRELLREEAADGTAVFFSSHILGEVEAVCDRIGVLDDGQLVAEDTIDGLRDRFAGECTIELRIEDCDDTTGELETLSGVLDATVEGDSIVVSCAEPTVKADVVRWVGERATITDVVSEETSLESMFERYTGGAAGEGTDGGESSERAKRSEVSA